MNFILGKKQPSTLVLASHNHGKLLELEKVLQHLDWAVKSAADFNLAPPEENGGSYRANAKLKALYTAQHTGFWALADDSGLEVNALDGLPGVDTATYGGWEKLLKAIENMPADQLQARFVCVLALATPEGEYLFFEGTCEGSICREAHGDGGFGYDPVFIPQGDTRTFASMSKEEKQVYSHRGKALQALLTHFDGLQLV